MGGGGLYTFRMRSLKWTWICFAAIWLLAVATGFLARPVDELEGIRSLHPRELTYRDSRGFLRRSFQFYDDPSLVMAKLPIPRAVTAQDCSADHRSLTVYQFPSGRAFTFLVWGKGIERPDGMTCQVSTSDGSIAPWYMRAWRTMKLRLGLRP